MIIYIKTKHNGVKECFVDDSDFEKVSKFKWCAVKRRNTFYALSRMNLGDGKSKVIRMHRILLDGDHIDHKDGNGLNNQKNNLRVATVQQNSFNAGLSRRNKSGAKGVYKTKYGTYCVTIIKSRNKISGGCFKDINEAAKRYNELAKEHFGEFAWLNPL